MFQSRHFSLEFLRDVFNLIKDDEMAVRSVFLVCKHWRQAALEHHLLWKHHVYANNDQSFFYHDFNDRLRAEDKIENLIFCAATPAFIRSPLDLTRPRRSIVDPAIHTKFNIIIPRNLPQARNLKLEVPSCSWGLLEKFFTNHSISHIERLELSRFHNDITDTFTASEYTCGSLNEAMKDAKIRWNLQCLHLRGCFLNLEGATAALANLEELTIDTLPVTATYHPDVVVSFLRNFRELRRLTLTWATRWHLGSVKQFGGGPVTMERLEFLSITTEADTCACIFTSLSIPPTCRVSFVVTPTSNPTTRNNLNFIDRCLTDITNHYLKNTGCPSTNMASLRVNGGVSGLHSCHSDGSIPFLLYLYLTEWDATNGFNRNDLLKLFRRILRFAFGSSLKELQMDIDLDLLDPLDLAMAYPTQFSITRGELPRLDKLAMKFPLGEQIWERPMNGQLNTQYRSY